MIIKDFLNRALDIEKILLEINGGELHGVNYYEIGKMDDIYDVLELIFSRSKGWVYAYKIYLSKNIIIKIERVKFETMCGGWRSKYYSLRRFPVWMNENEVNVSNIMKSFLLNP